jgi:hypothetical protein
MQQDGEINGAWISTDPERSVRDGSCRVGCELDAATRQNTADEWSLRYPAAPVAASFNGSLLSYSAPSSAQVKP